MAALEKAVRDAEEEDEAEEYDQEAGLETIQDVEEEASPAEEGLETTDF